MKRSLGAVALLVTSCGGAGVRPTLGPIPIPTRVGVNELRVVGNAKTGETLLGRFANAPSLVVNGRGDPVVAWDESFELSPRMRIARRNGTAWHLIDQRSDCHRPHLAITASGAVIATRICPVGTRDGVFVAQYEGDAWRDITGSEQEGAVYIAATHAIYGVTGVDPVGRISIVIANAEDGLHLFQHSGHEWQPLPAIGGMSEDAHHPALVVDARGVLTLAWSEAKHPRGSTEVYGAQFDGSWKRFGGGDGVVSRHPVTQKTPPGEDGHVCLTMQEGNFSSDSPSLALGPDGQIWLAWGGKTVAGPISTNSRCVSTQIYVGTYADGAWSGPGNTALDPGISRAVMTASTPSIAFPFRGRPLVAWYDTGDAEGIHVRSGEAASWSPVAEFPDIPTGGPGAVMAAHASTVCMARSFSAGIGVRCAR